MRSSTVALVSRRRFLSAGLGASVAAAAWPAWATAHRGQPEAAARFFAWEEAAPGVWVAYSPAAGPGLGGNSSVLLGDGAVLIDTKYPALSQAVRREAGSFGKGLAAVINTHHHADHTGGNLAFTPDLPVLAHPGTGARVLAQLQRYVDGIPGDADRVTKMTDEAAKPVAAEAQAMVEQAGQLRAEQFAPTKAIDLDTDLDLGGVRLRASHGGPAHTDNDIAIFVPGANVLVAGDLVFRQLHPFLDRSSGGVSAGWIRTLEALDAMCDDQTVVIPGHGRAAGRVALREQADYLRALGELMSAAVREGKTREEAIKTPVPEAFSDYGSPQRFPLTLGAVYDEAAADVSGTK
jgi:cyclase